MTIHEHLISINACELAQNWAADKKTGQECWDTTNRVDWLFWWAAQTGQKKQVVICTKIIADSVSHLKNVYAADIADDAAFAAFADVAVYAAYVADTAANIATYAAYAAYDAYNAYAAYNAYVAYTAHDAYDAYAAYADDAADIAAYATYEKQKSLNLKIARENLTCPFPG